MSVSARCVPICLAGLVGGALLHAADRAAADEAAQPSRFFDSDGWFDGGKFLDSGYGFAPLAAPITEPAVGYGVVAALLFIDRDVSGKGQRYTRPNMTAIGGLATENGTRALFGGHLGTWLDGRLRTLVALAGADVNLEFFGLGGDRQPGEEGLGYTVMARGGVAGASYRLGETPLWIGLRYAAAKTSVALADPELGFPGGTSEDFDDLWLAGLTPSVTLDMRDNFFTPTDGWYVDVSVPLFREALGGDRNYEKITLMAMHYRPLTRSLFLSARGAARDSSDGTPFYLRPFVWLRGVEALRYQGAQAAEVEAELRWQLHRRLSLVGFGGAGIARSETDGDDGETSVAAGGAGVRYLFSRAHGLHMGIDVAVGPDQPILYVVFGNAWARP